MNKSFRIYLITNKVNGMQYVGCTSQSVAERFKQHTYDVKRTTDMLHTAMGEYGITNFDVELIEDNIPTEKAEEAERYYIELYNTYYLNGHGYNMTIGGHGTIGYKFTQEDRAKISNIHKGRKFSAERNEYLRIINTGREYKPEWREALSKARLGKFTGTDNSFYGKHHTDDTKLKIRESNSGLAVVQLDDAGNIINEFYNLHDAGQWVSDNGLTKAKGTTCAGRIRVVCYSTTKACKAYGYFWKFKERSID